MDSIVVFVMLVYPLFLMCYQRSLALYYLEHANESDIKGHLLDRFLL